MTKILKIEHCRECPHNDHKGAFGAPAYIPVCHLANREQPWEAARGDGTMVVARRTVDIPDWCPLETYESKES